MDWFKIGLRCSWCKGQFVEEHGHPVLCDDCWASQSAVDLRRKGIQRAKYPTRSQLRGWIRDARPTWGQMFTAVLFAVLVAAVIQGLVVAAAVNKAAEDAKIELKR